MIILIMSLLVNQAIKLTHNNILIIKMKLKANKSSEKTIKIERET